MKSDLPANPRGGYRFLPGIEPYSCGVVAARGWEIVHVVLAHPLAWHDGLVSIRRYLEQIGRDRHALCGVELRCPEPFSIDGFIAFNQQYRSLLEDWDMLVDGANPVARTNVAPVEDPPSESVVYGFSYTEPSDTGPSDDVYYNYYATQVVHHWGGEPWDEWNSVMRDKLVNSQAQVGHEAGSWYWHRPESNHEKLGGRLYCTAMATMILEVYYRHLPIYTKQSTEHEFPID